MRQIEELPSSTRQSTLSEKEQALLARALLINGSPHHGRDFVRKFLPALFVKSSECDWIARKINISEDYNMEKSIFGQLGGTYHKQGDYFLPDLAVPEGEKRMGPAAFAVHQRTSQGLYVSVRASFL